MTELDRVHQLNDCVTVSVPHHAAFNAHSCTWLRSG